MLVDVLNNPFMHQDSLRLAANLRVNGDWENESVVFSVCEIELLKPELFDDLCGHKSVLNRSLLVIVLIAEVLAHIHRNQRGR